MIVQEVQMIRTNSFKFIKCGIAAAHYYWIKHEQIVGLSIRQADPG